MIQRPLNSRLPMLKFSLIAALLLTPLAAQAVEGGTAKAGNLVVSGAWARPTIGASTEGVIYLTIANTGSADDTLKGASTPAAASAELHTMSMDGAMMKMRAVATMTIKAGGTVAFEPDGDHIMLSGVKAPLHVGDKIWLKLVFDRAGMLVVDVPVMNEPPTTP
jgi:copper(I)-binding protein